MIDGLALVMLDGLALVMIDGLALVMLDGLALVGTTASAVTGRLADAHCQDEQARLENQPTGADADRRQRVARGRAFHQRRGPHICRVGAAC
jgi:hypothetical protein